MLIRRAAVLALFWLAAVPLSAGWRTSIEGSIIAGPRRGEVLLERLDRERPRHRVVARSSMRDGRFVFEFLQPAPALYRVTLPRGRQVELALRPGQSLAFEHDPGGGAFSSSGSPDTRELQTGIHLDRENRARGETPSARYAALTAFLATLSSDLAVYALFSRQPWNAEMADVDLAAIEEIHRRLAASDRDAASVVRLGDLLERYRRTAVGAVLPDVALKDPDGATIRVSDLRGRHVVVRFWATKCAPCREQGRELGRIHERYADSGLELYSVSFDDARDVWMRSIEKDGPQRGHHVSDLWDGGYEAASVYLTAPPSVFLLDPAGRILAKNLSWEALGRALEAIYGY